MDISEAKERIELKYEPNTEGPSRLFRSFEAMLSAFEINNSAIVKGVDPFLEVHFYVERIQESSIIVWLLKKILTPDYDDLLIKPEIIGDVGDYLSRAENALIEEVAKLDGQRVGNSAITAVENRIYHEAKETGVSASRNYSTPNKLKIAESIDLISRSTQLLVAGEHYVFPYGNERPSISKVKSEIDLKQIRIEMTNRAVTTLDRRVMMVKIADLLGRSKWRFRYNDKPVDAKISDLVWLERFHTKQDLVTPGDSLEADVEQIDYYDKNEKLIDSEITILKVVDVREGRIQSSNPSKDSL